MGFFDDGVSVVSRHSSHSHGHRSSHRRSHSHSGHSSHKKHKRSKSRSRSRSRSRGRAESIANFLTGGGGSNHYSRHNKSSSSFFGLGNSSRKSFFGFGRTPSSSSYYKRSPRQNFVNRAWRKLKRLLRDLVHYAKRHPWKVFVLVIMPLITTGALAGLLARFGLRLPRNIERMMGIAAKAGSGNTVGLVGEAVRVAGGIGGSGSRNVRFESRRRVETDSGGWGMGGGLGAVGKFFS